MKRRDLLLGLGALPWLTAVPAAAQSDLVGRPLPALRARPIVGETELDERTFRGRVVLMAFMATWCGVCQHVEPVLDRLYQRHLGDGFTVLGLSYESRSVIFAVYQRRSVSFPIVQCTGRSAVLYGARALPRLVLADRRGIVRAAWTGGGSDNLEELVDEVDDLVS